MGTQSVSVSEKGIANMAIFLYNAHCSYVEDLFTLCCLRCSLFWTPSVGKALPCR